MTRRPMILRMLLVLTLTILASGCSKELPQSDRAQIAAVQSAYDQEFATALQTNGAVSSQSRFPKTLTLIEQTRNPPPAPEVAAYLSVLEGMIYLQTDQTGKAALLEDDVARAAGVLKRVSGIATRDVLFAESFGAMVDGREAMIALNGISGLSDADQARRGTIATALRNSSDSLTGTLCRERRAGHLAEPTGDDGAAMVAGYGATFLATSDVAAQSVCGFEPPDTALCAGFETRADLVDARNLRAAFPGTLAPGSQLRRLDRDISTRLDQAYRGAPPAATDPCR